MERKIGDTFEYEGKNLQVKESTHSNCDGCFFDEQCSPSCIKVAGHCDFENRTDKKDVIFVEAEGKQEGKPWERKIGEVFEYRGKKLKVLEEPEHGSCKGCYFFEEDCGQIHSMIGECEHPKRSDSNDVIFAITDEPEKQQVEQPQEQTEQPQKLNLCEVLKYCPQGKIFWSPMLGDVELRKINHEAERICVIEKKGSQWWINADATMTFGDITSEEIMLYPSKEQRDWTKVKYEPKKELPKTWEEFCKNYPLKEEEAFFDAESEINICGIKKFRDRDEDRLVLPSEQAAEAHLALMQLHQLRDAWREGWLPDYNNDNQCKYAITKLRSKYEIFEYKVSSFFLSFQDERRADEFKDCFIDLIMKAGDLI